MWAVGWLVREEALSIFTRGGVIGDGVRDATQVAWVPMRHIVKKVSRVLGEARFEGLLFSAYGEPLGAPVRAILEEPCPYIGLLLSVAVDEVGSEDCGGLRRASL